MIIDAKTVVLTLLVAAIAFYVGLKFVRKFALSIAQENHDAVAAMDREDETKLMKKQRDADAAAAAAYAKVEPLLTVATKSGTSSASSSRPSTPTGSDAA